MRKYAKTDQEKIGVSSFFGKTDADSNAMEVIDSQRFHNATGVGHLGTPTSGVLARVYYAATYYDNVDRVIASADAGTNGGSAWTRPSTAPASSPTLLGSNYQ